MYSHIRFLCCLIVLLLFVLFQNDVYGQPADYFEPDMEFVQKCAMIPYSNAIKELEKLPHKERVEYSLVLASVQLSNLYNIKSAMQFCEYALSEAEKHNLSKGRVYISQSYLFNSANKQTEAINAIEKAGICFKEEKDTKSLKECLSWLGHACYNYGFFNKSLQAYDELLKICIDTNDEFGKAQTLFAVGEVYCRTGRKKQARESAYQAKAIFEEIDNKKGLADCLKLMGNIYSGESEYLKAKQYYLKASWIYDSTNDSHGKGNCNFNLGLLNIDLKQYPEAVGHLMEAIYCYTDAGSVGGVCIAKTQLGRAYYFLGEYAKAELSLITAEFFNKEYSQYRLAQTKEYLGDLKTAQKNEDEALEYYKASADLFEEVQLKADQARVKKKIQGLHN